MKPKIGMADYNGPNPKRTGTNSSTGYPNGRIVSRIVMENPNGYIPEGEYTVTEKGANYIPGKADENRESWDAGTDKNMTHYICDVLKIGGQFPEGINNVIIYYDIKRKFRKGALLKMFSWRFKWTKYNGFELIEDVVPGDPEPGECAEIEKKYTDAVDENTRLLLEKMKAINELSVLKMKCEKLLNPDKDKGLKALINAWISEKKWYILAGTHIFAFVLGISLQWV